ncbi:MULTISPECIES: hypothetical protein [Trichocoleus]|nr:hypothetical protein [Trichocoleus sp. FACHB-262]
MTKKQFQLCELAQSQGKLGADLEGSVMHFDTILGLQAQGL